jgi:hypothetical protein
MNSNSSNKKVSVFDLPFAIDAPVVDVLRQLEHTNLHEFSTSGESVRGARSQIRYLAALWPSASIPELVEKIHYIINNRDLLPEDVRAVLNGVAIGHEEVTAQDVSLVLRGQYLSDASRRTREVPIQVIQTIGKCLQEGMTLRATAQAARCSYDTVEAVDMLLGLRRAHDGKMMMLAMKAVRDGVSVRRFAALHGLSRGRAHRLVLDAKAALQQLESE